MKIIFRSIGFCLLLTLATRLAAAEVPPVPSSAARQAGLDLAKKIISPADSPLPSALVDPFHPAAFAEIVAGASASPGGGAVGADSPTAPATVRSNHTVLQAIAAALKPNGFFVIGGHPTLVFGQKKVKAGSFLTITFEGNPYTLEIAAIDNQTFTLRLNREEYTRPIK